MDIDLAALPDDVEMLQRLVRALAAERSALSEAQAEIERLRLIVRKLQRGQFGRRAERLDDNQLRFGLEDLEVDLARAEAKLPSAADKSSKPAPKVDRPALPAHLTREDRRLDIEHKACSCCGGALHLIGETVSEMLDHVPARLRVIRIRRPRYGCRACGTIHQAPALERPIAKGLATPGLLAHVLVSKYCDHLPLYRQSQIFARQGSNSTARRSPTGLAERSGGWSPCRHGSPSMSLAHRRCLPMTPRSPCSIPVAAAPRPAGSGSMLVMTGRGADPILRRRCTSTAPIAVPSGLRVI
jgi:transposase